MANPVQGRPCSWHVGEQLMNNHGAGFILDQLTTGLAVSWLLKTVLQRAASRANMLYLAARTHNRAAVCLHAAHNAALREFWPDWLPTVTLFSVTAKRRINPCRFTVHSHFSERGYQGMLPIALIQRPVRGRQRVGFERVLSYQSHT
jgi:hypothetical protein